MVSPVGELIIPVYSLKRLFSGMESGVPVRVGLMVQLEKVSPQRRCCTPSIWPGFTLALASLPPSCPAPRGGMSPVLPHPTLPGCSQGWGRSQRAEGGTCPSLHPVSSQDRGISHLETVLRGSSVHWACQASFQKVMPLILLRVQEASEQGKCSVNTSHQMCTLSRSR